MGIALCKKFTIFIHGQTLRDNNEYLDKHYGIITNLDKTRTFIIRQPLLKCNEHSLLLYKTSVVNNEKRSNESTM